jgi:trimeric autotransporter adhesin
MHWDLTEKDLDCFVEAIKLGLEDASVRAREVARGAYMNMFNLYPEKAEKIKSMLPKAHQLKLARTEAGLLESTGGVSTAPPSPGFGKSLSSVGTDSSKIDDDSGPASLDAQRFLSSNNCAKKGQHNVSSGSLGSNASSGSLNASRLHASIQSNSEQPHFLAPTTSSVAHAVPVGTASTTVTGTATSSTTATTARGKAFAGMKTQAPSNQPQNTNVSASNTFSRKWQHGSGSVVSETQVVHSTVKKKSGVVSSNGNAPVHGKAKLASTGTVYSVSKGSSLRASDKSSALTVESNTKNVGVEEHNNVSTSELDIALGVDGDISDELVVSAEEAAKSIQARIRGALSRRRSVVNNPFAALSQSSPVPTGGNSHDTSHSANSGDTTSTNGHTSHSTTGKRSNGAQNGNCSVSVSANIKPGAFNASTVNSAHTPATKRGLREDYGNAVIEPKTDPSFSTSTTNYYTTGTSAHSSFGGSTATLHTAGVHDLKASSSACRSTSVSRSSGRTAAVGRGNISASNTLHSKSASKGCDYDGIGEGDRGSSPMSPTTSWRASRYRLYSLVKVGS